MDPRRILPWSCKSGLSDPLIHAGQHPLALWSGLSESARRAVLVTVLRARHMTGISNTGRSERKSAVVKLADKTSVLQQRIAYEKNRTALPEGYPAFPVIPGNRYADSE